MHEGAAVTKGSKYVIRTEVLYMLDTKGRHAAPQAAMQLPAAAAAAAAPNGGAGAAGAKKQ